MAQKISTTRPNEVAHPRVGHQAFKPVAIPAVIAAMQMNKSATPARIYELPAILRKEAQIG